MGRESAITYEHIAAIADMMKLEGLKPTSRSVRERLGNTGSMGTVNKLLARWKAGQERQVSAALVLPPALQRVLLEFMDSELTSARATLEADLAELQQEGADLASENERQVQDNDNQREEIELLRAEVAQHKGQAGQLAADLIITREDAARERSGAELARTELAKAQLRLEAMPRLEADLDRLRVALEATQQARQQAEQDAAVYSAKLEAAERRAKEADARTEKASTFAAQLADKIDATARELAQTQASLQAAQTRLEASARELAEAKQAATAAQAAAKKSGEEAAELRGKAIAEHPAPPAAGV